MNSKIINSAFWRALVIATVLIIAAFSVNAQTIVKDAGGNYVAIKKAKDSAIDKATGYTYTDTHGKAWPVYRSKTGREYALITSRYGNVYRKYMVKVEDKE